MKILKMLFGKKECNHEWKTSGNKRTCIRCGEEQIWFSDDDVCGWIDATLYNKVFRDK